LIPEAPSLPELKQAMAKVENTRGWPPWVATAEIAIITGDLVKMVQNRRGWGLIAATFNLRGI
jgi:hypothetical protein